MSDSDKSDDVEHLRVSDLIKFAAKYKARSLFIDDGITVERVRHFQIREDEDGNSIVILSNKPILR